MANVGGGAPEAQRPPASEQEVHAYSQAKARHIDELFQNDLVGYKNEFNSLEPSRTLLQEEELHNRELQGQVTDESAASLKNQKLQEQMWVRQTLANLRNPPGNRPREEIYNALGINDQNKIILDHLVQTLNDGDLYGDVINVPILYKVLHSALNNGNPNPLLILGEDDFAQLARQNTNLQEKIGESLYRAASRLNIPEKDINEFLNKRIRELGAKRRGGAYTEDEFKKKFSSEAPEDKEALAFYEAINLGDIDKFTAYYQNKAANYRRLLLEQNPRGQMPEVQYNRWVVETAAKATTHDIHKTLLYITNNIFNEVLARGPEESFQATARNLGAYMADPIRVFDEIVSGNLSALTTRAQKLVHTPRERGDYYVFKRETKPGYDPSTGRTIEREVPTALLVESGIDRFVESLRVMATEERGALQYQFDLGFLMRNHEAIPKGSTFMQTLSGMARKSFTAATIDNLYMLPYNEMIQAAVISLEQSYKELFHEHEWKKTADLDHEVFAALPKARKRVLQENGCA
jgi:hypothetical protein